MKLLLALLLCLSLVACSSEEPTTEPTATPTAETKPEPTETTESAEPQVVFEASGTGDDVVTGYSTDTARTIEFTHSGEGYFSVWAHGEDDQLMVSAIDNYTGKVLLKTGGDLSFEISASGDWTMKVYDTVGNSDTDTFGGSSDFITPISISSSGSYDVTCDGDGYFSVWAYSPDGAKLLVSDTAPYEGTVYLGLEGEQVFFEISSTGNWTISPAE